ncbi:PilX N-terminal domain-containing pilus assembly protein [Pseudomonas synxantha]|uniref:Pilus assembly protein PilX n=2 Tax=Pseudomonas synxantha TaxID=47883 RepID=A0ABS0UGT1_9PSED|nr:PilX N-terminal domain-containing pilus assembly protein [Pseudomonas synxantha]KRP49981.1 pilus assembly protein PilX [Pseudomonas synxantha]MBI6563815.1 pilus assembly protein PilX [Pseudomonas synxantha]MBI6581051.1 pilus assembly protein PilX [Pseudomonas synxantha]MBI6642237.1 pilus assembly protein PilX [Pseudomonas synxantha]
MVMLGRLHVRQAGMVLLISLVLLLLLSQVGLSSMQGAVSQQKVASSLWHRNQSFQHAESGLRLGEWAVQRVGGALPICHSVTTCAPPVEAFSLVGGGTNPASAVSWVALMGGFYGVQALGMGAGMVHLPIHASAALYRVTAVGLAGQSRTVLETVYARVEEGGSVRFRRVLWRQLQ